MNPDIHSLVSDWLATAGKRPSRVLETPDGQRFLQLRIEQGILQMLPDGRPDGLRYGEFESALEFFRAGARAAQPELDTAWSELYRELRQLNYRRVAAMELMGGEDDESDPPASGDQEWLQRALRDTRACLEILDLFDSSQRSEVHGDLLLRASLLLNQARLASRDAVRSGDPDAAIDFLEDGREALLRLAIESGEDEDAASREPSVQYLEQLGRRLRERHGLSRTLREQLADAVEHEDFESAARLRDRMSKRPTPYAESD